MGLSASRARIRAGGISYFVKPIHTNCQSILLTNEIKKNIANSHIFEAVMLLFAASQMCCSDYANVNERSGAISTFI